MITSENYEMLRVRNFGRRALLLTMSVPAILGQVKRYDPVDAAAVSDRVREREGLYQATEALVETYREAISDFRRCHVADEAAERQAAARFLEAIAPTSNTFHLAEFLAPLERRARGAEAKLQRLAETLAMDKCSGWELARIGLRNPRAPAVVNAGAAFSASLTVVNRAKRVLSSLGAYPVHLSYHWLAESGEMLVTEGIRSELYPPLPPGASFPYLLNVQAPDKAGHYMLRLTLVQENVAWLDQRGVHCDLACQVL
jgi:hypothetical protein